MIKAVICGTPLYFFFGWLNCVLVVIAIQNKKEQTNPDLLFNV